MGWAVLLWGLWLWSTQHRGGLPRRHKTGSFCCKILGSKAGKCPSFPATRRQTLRGVPSHTSHPLRDAITHAELFASFQNRAFTPSAQVFAPIAHSTQTIKTPTHTSTPCSSATSSSKASLGSYLPICFCRTECRRRAGLRMSPWRRKQSLFSREEGTIWGVEKG